MYKNVYIKMYKKIYNKQKQFKRLLPDNIYNNEPRHPRH